MAPGVVSLIERGHLDQVSTKALRRVAAALEIKLDIVVRLPHGELDRLLNEGHAWLHEELAHLFVGLPGWLQAPEVSFAVYRERGVIDILAFHEPTGSLLVVELKTEFVSLEDLLTTMDVRMRHAARIGRDRGWSVRSVSCWVVFNDSKTNRRRVKGHATVLRSAFPSDGRAMRGWLARPTGAIRALSFWTNFNGPTGKRMDSGRRRVRVQRSIAKTGPTSSSLPQDQVRG